MITLKHIKLSKDYDLPENLKELTLGQWVKCKGLDYSEGTSMTDEWDNSIKWLVEGFGVR